VVKKVRQASKTVKQPSAAGLVREVLFEFERLTIENRQLIVENRRMRGALEELSEYSEPCGHDLIAQGALWPPKEKR
jgi:hypothetical protein